MDCLVLTMITNLAAGLQGPLNHEEVFEEAKKAGPRLADLITKIILKIDSTRPNHVRIKDEVGESSFFDSYKFRMDLPQRIPINDWIGDAIKLWDRTNLGEKEVEDVYWFMAQGASLDVASQLGLINI